MEVGAMNFNTVEFKNCREVGFDGYFECELKLHEDEWSPYTVGEEEMKPLYDRIVEEGNIAAFVPLDGWREGHKQVVGRVFADAIHVIAGSPEQINMAAWPDKVAAAKEILADNSADAGVLLGYIKSSGKTKLEAAQYVLFRSRMFKMFSAYAEALEGEVIATFADGEYISDQELRERTDEKITALITRANEIVFAAKQGDMSKLEALENELQGIGE